MSCREDAGRLRVTNGVTVGVGKAADPPVRGTFSRPPVAERLPAGASTGDGAHRIDLVAAYRSRMPVDAAMEPHLRGVLEDALAAPGGLARARLVGGILRAFGLSSVAAADAAVAVEYFHTASLLLDDLPAMDDAGERRGRPCAHLVHGEAASILGALAFISRGYELLWGVLSTLPLERRSAAAGLVGECLGPRGVLEGQARDLFFADWTTDGGRPEEVLSVARGKTVTLIRLSVVLPGLLAGVASWERELLETVARTWGTAYQVLDDAKDLLMAPAESGKTPGRDELRSRPNFPSVAGWPATLRLLHELLEAAAEATLRLSRGRGEWSVLEDVQSFLEGEVDGVEERAGCPLAAAV